VIGFLWLFMALYLGFLKTILWGDYIAQLFTMAFLAAAFSFIWTLLYFVVTLFLPRGATITTRIIAAISFFGGLTVSGFIVERIGQPLPGRVAVPVAIVMLVATEFLFLRHLYRKV